MKFKHFLVLATLLAALPAGLVAVSLSVGAARAADPIAANVVKPDAPHQNKQIGRIVHVRLPITGATFERTRRTVRRAIEMATRENARFVLIVEFDSPKGGKEFGRGSNFGAAHDLANFLSGNELASVRTVAYLPGPVEGHAILPVLACQEIIMAKDASIGAAGIDEERINPTLRTAYMEIVGRRRTVSPVVALGMLDKDIEVLQVETEVDRQFVTPEDLEKLKKNHAVKEPVVVKRAGEPFLLSGEEARRLEIARYLAADRRDLLRAIDLPPTAVNDDPSLEADWKAVRVELTGPIRGDNVEQAQRMIEEQIRGGANFICLWIDSPGGSLVDSMKLANFLGGLDPGKVRTVAYVPEKARADAAIVALACDQLVMHPDATLGGAGDGNPSKDEMADATRSLRVLMPQKGRAWSPAAAMIDPGLDVFRCVREGDVECFSSEELDEQPDKAKWTKGDRLTSPGAPMKLSGVDAERLGIANGVVRTFEEFKQYYGLENDPSLIEPGWADFLIRAMASPGIALLLLLIGGSALYIELHTPGLGIGGFVATICFLLFFWSRFLGGTAGWLEAVLFAAGVACLLLEIFVIPGFGIFGLGGGALILASIVLASQTFVWPHNEYQLDEFVRSLLTLGGACLGILVVIVLLRNRLPRSRLFSNLMLEPPAVDEAESIRRREALAFYDDMLGAHGVTTTQLTPSGKARFGERLIDVIAEGEVIGRGVSVEIVDVRGNRVTVREVG